MFVPLCSEALTSPITNRMDLTHLCDRFPCVHVCTSGFMCYLLTHVEVVCMFFCFLIVFCCLATVFMLWCFPLQMEMAQYSSHIPRLPFLPELPPFCFSLLPLSCSLTCISNPRLTCWCFVQLMGVCGCVGVFASQNANRENRWSRYWSYVWSQPLKSLINIDDK